MTDPHQAIEELKRSLRNVASDAQQQIGYLKSIGGGSVDEFALELDDAIRMLWLPSQHGLITAEQIAAAKDVDEAMDDLVELRRFA